MEEGFGHTEKVLLLNEVENVSLSYLTWRTASRFFINERSPIETIIFYTIQNRLLDYVNNCKYVCSVGHYLCCSFLLFLVSWYRHQAAECFAMG